jgi:integrase/recombinase XerD
LPRNRTYLCPHNWARGLVGYDVSLTRQRFLGEKDLSDYMSILELSGVSKGHMKEVNGYLKNYLIHLNYTIEKSLSIDYFRQIKERYAVASYKKQMYQILKFLTYLGVDWAQDIELPSDPIYYPKRISQQMIQQTLSYFEGHQYFKQIKALVLLGASSGMRAEEMYQLNPEDIDIENRIVHINHNPKNGQTTKTSQSRVSFFTIEAKEAYIEYLTYFHNGSGLNRLFSQTHMIHLFRNAPIRVKDLRKFFSQEWDHRGGPTSIKKILMGHSLRGDVDLMHYNYQAEEDLKKIFDKVMNGRV